MGLSRKSWIRIILLLIMVFAVAFLHYLTGSEKSRYYGIICRFYYLPIICAGIWFRLQGGITIALLITVIFAPHVLFRWGPFPSASLEQSFEVLAFAMTGVVTGALSSKLKQQRRKTETSLQELSRSYEKLKEQADMIIDIENQLRRADRLTALGELSAGMAHEIRNPLGSIRGTAEILRDALPEDNRFNEFAGILVSETDRLNKVVEDFLDFARPASNEQERFVINNVLDEVIQLTAQQAKKNRVRIYWEPRDLPPVVGETGQFKQVFLNLVLNALQAMKSGGELTIATSISDCGRILIQFKDSGPGIPDEDLDKVFNPFFTTKSDGTGLGLAITYRIVQNHCGQIKAENCPDGGALFTLTLKPADEPCCDGDLDGAENPSH